MRNNVLKTLSVFIIIMLITLCFSVVVFAAGEEVTWTLNSANYTQGKLMDAITAVDGSENGIITLNTDCSITMTKNFSSGNCLIDLDGHTITVDICGIVIGNDATLHVKDSKGTGSIVLKSVDSDCYVFDVKGKLEFESGSIILSRPEDSDAVCIKSSGSLVIGGGEDQSIADITNILAEGGKFQLIGTKGKAHKIGALNIAEGTELKLDCAITSGNTDITSLIVGGYNGTQSILVVDVSEKAVSVGQSNDLYKGHTATAAEVMGIANSNIKNETVYIILTICVTLIIISISGALIFVKCKKQKR